MKKILHSFLPFGLKEIFNTITLFTVFLSLFSTGYAGDEPFKTFKDYKVGYSAFNSNFISPEIATTYDITRGKNKGLVNIVVLENSATNNIGGRPALVSGYVSNIIAQQQKLEFFEVNEGTATYYLAPFRFENEDFMTFKIRVQPDPDKPADEISFQRTFYHDK